MPFTAPSGVWEKPTLQGAGRSLLSTRKSYSLHRAFLASAVLVVIDAGWTE